jgi:Spy/CpxP family protein refolding chaperone
LSARTTKPLFLLTFVVALIAGATAGIFASRVGPLARGERRAGDGPGPGHLADQLDLSDDQRDRMREIWEVARDQSRRYVSDLERLQKGRDQELVDLLNDQQKAQYETIAKKYADQFVNLATKRDETFQAAVEKTKGILNPQQREKYEKLLSERGGPPPPPGRDLLPPPVIRKGTLPSTQYAK